MSCQGKATHPANRELASWKTAFDAAGHRQRRFRKDSTHFLSQDVSACYKMNREINLTPNTWATSYT